MNMGREVRMVPADWQHPTQCVWPNFKPTLKPLHYNSGRYLADAAEFLERANRDGLQEAIDWMGCPDEGDYMPDWQPSECTHYMMYEDTSEGTPISPAFETPEELARWLVDNNASAFGGETATYEGWLRVANGGYAPSMIMCGGVMQTGVDAVVTKGNE